MINEKLAKLEAIEALLKDPADVVAAVQKLAEQNTALTKELEKVAKERVRALVASIPAKAQANAKGVKVLVERLDLDAQSLKDLGYALREQHPDLAFVAGSVIDGKPLLAVSLGKAFAATTGATAVNIIKLISPAIKGGGGGQPDYATAGGKEPAGMSSALEKAASLLA